MKENSLIITLEQAYDELEISGQQRGSIGTYLGLIYNKDVPTWEHSVRVGLIGKKIAQYTHIVEPKALFYPGLLHDSGKPLVDSASLNAENFDEDDMKELERHVLYGYKLLKDIHPFSAAVLLFHHYFQENKYPKHLPANWDNGYTEGEKALIKYCGRLLSIADTYDAMTTRTNNKFVEDGTERVKKLTPEEAREKMFATNKDQTFLIEQLYKEEIFK
ncbi:HD domain-containing protein [Candidatus Pacearchaeota archaeon]|nr:HD domain-containing protein [Candidatus Pacearchaeota archaeon]